MQSSLAHPYRRSAASCRDESSLYAKSRDQGQAQRFRASVGFDFCGPHESQGRYVVPS